MTLAHILRPKSIQQIVGQTHLIQGVIGQMSKTGKIINTIIWGPPGTGKTSIAQALALDTKSHFRKINATESSVKEIRTILDFAKKSKPQDTILFVDEIHRFNKSQQDVLLPAVEEGTITLFGATTENPKFSVNSTILSRCIVIETKPLTKKESVELISKVAKHYSQKITFDPPEALNTLLNRSNGDARKLITVLEACIEVLQCNQITNEVLDAIIPTKHLIFDSTGQDHFDIAHCYQEAIQNSDVDSAIYWLAKWLESGEEPAYICRRMLITAFEDCYSNPEAASLAMAATFATERTGMPECMIPMAAATCMMATSPRDKTAYYAIKEAINDVKNKTTIHVPPELRAGTYGYTKMVNKQYYNPPTEKLYAIGDMHGAFCYGPCKLDETLRFLPSEGLYIYELDEKSSATSIIYEEKDQKWVKTK